MYTFNAFVKIPELANNNINMVAPFGELSVKAETFSKDIRHISDKTQYPGIEIVSFNLYDKTSTPMSEVPEKLANQSLKLANFLYTQYSNNAIPLKQSKQSLTNGIIAEFPDLRHILIGDILESGSPGKRLIDYIKFNYTADDKEYKCTLWFSDKAFRNQYPLYEIHVIPPVGEIDRLNAVPALAMEANESVTIEFAINRINAVTREHPNTATQVFNLQWNDPEGSSTKFMTRWTVVIWGQAGNDRDAIKAAIRDYIASNTQFDNWPVIFPDLYSDSEFMIMPFWDKTAAPKDAYDDGLYSSVTTMYDINQQIERLIPVSYGNYQTIESHKNKNLAIAGTAYRHMNMMILGSPHNKEGKVNFRDMFHDYMAVSSDKADFARMSSKTQDWVLKLLEVMELARDWSPGTELSTDFTLATKASRDYIGFDFDGFTYFVLTRFGYLKET